MTTSNRISNADFARIDAEMKAYLAASAVHSAAFTEEVNKIVALGNGYNMGDRDTAWKLAEARVGVMPAYPLNIDGPNAGLVGAYTREARRRQANATREKNTASRAATALTQGAYAVGEACEVHAFGHWYKGEVTKLGRTGKVTVKYTSGTGAAREKAVDSTKIRKA